MTTPVVSVVMAACNGAARIGDAIASLRAQSFPHWEAIVVDDCSTDATREVVAASGDPRVRLIARTQHTGPAHCRNRAFAAARGRYIAGLEQADLCHPERFARQVAYLDAQPDVVLVATATDVPPAVHQQVPPVTTPALIDWLLLVGNPLVWSSTMLRADAVRGFAELARPDYAPAEDFDLYHRLAGNGRIARIDEVLLTHRPDDAAMRPVRDAADGGTVRVLADAYAGIVPDPATAAVDMSTHAIQGIAVRDGDTLRRLGETLDTLQSHFLATRQPDRESEDLIRWETARLWTRIGRAALRSGGVTLGERIAARPDRFGLGRAGLAELLTSGLVGAVRRSIRGNGRAGSRA